MPVDAFCWLSYMSQKISLTENHYTYFFLSVGFEMRYMVASKT